MQCSLRPWVTTGLVLTGAGVTAVAPIGATAPLLGLQQASVQLTDSDTPFPLVDFTQFSANATANYDAILNAIAPGFVPDFSGLSNSAFYNNLGALLIEAGMGLTIGTSPTAAGTAITGVVDDVTAALAAGNFTAVFNDLMNAIPTVLNGYVNGIPPTDGVLNGAHPSSLLALLLQTITSQSAWVGGDHTLTGLLPLATWNPTQVPTGDTAGELYLNSATALSTLIAPAHGSTPAGFLNGFATFLGASVSGNDLDFSVPTAVSNLIAPAHGSTPAGIFNGIATFLGASVSGNDLDINVPTALRNLLAGNPLVSEFGLSVSGNALFINVPDAVKFVLGNLGNTASNFGLSISGNNLDLNVPTAVDFILHNFLGSTATNFGLSVSGTDFDIHVPTAVNTLINSPGFATIKGDFGLSVSGNNLDINTEDSVNWAVGQSFFNCCRGFVSNIGATSFHVQVGSGKGSFGFNVSYPTTIAIQVANGNGAISFPLAPGNGIVGIPISSGTGDISIPLGTGTGDISVPLTTSPNGLDSIPLGSPVPILPIGDINDPNGVPPYVEDLAKDLLALMGQPTDLTSNLDVNGALPADLGLSIAGGSDLQVNLANMLAELLNIFFPST